MAGSTEPVACRVLAVCLLTLAALALWACAATSGMTSRELLDRCISRKEAGDLAGAVRDCAEVVRREPRSAMALNSLGRVYFVRGDHDKAIEAFERALEARPGDLAALKNIGAALGRAGRLVEAVAAYERALAGSPSDTEALFELGVVHIMRGDGQAALAVADRLFVISPGAAKRLRELYWQSGIGHP